VPSWKLNFGTRSFRVAAPTIWNSLHADIRACSLYSLFTLHLKTFYFNTAFNERLLLGHLVTARASDSMFLCIDFVHITNCFLRLRLRNTYKYTEQMTARKTSHLELWRSVKTKLTWVGKCINTIYNSSGLLAGDHKKSPGESERHVHKYILSLDYLLLVLCNSKAVWLAVLTPGLYTFTKVHSITKQYNLAPAKLQSCSVTAKVNVGLEIMAA